MLYEEITSKLDSRVVLRYSDNHPSEQFSERFSIGLPLAVRVDGDNLRGYYYVPNSDISREKRIFLQKFGARKIDDVHTISFKSESFSVLNVFKDFLLVPSLVFDTFTLKNGKHFLTMRFHGSDLKSLSDTVIKFVSDYEGGKIEYLGDNSYHGPAFSSRWSLPDLFGTRINVSIRCHNDITNEHNLPPGTTIEPRFHYTTGIDEALFYLPSHSSWTAPEGFVKVSEEPLIYKGTWKSPLSLYFPVPEASRVPLYTTFCGYKVAEDSLECEAILPDWKLSIFLRRLREVEAQDSRVTFRINNIIRPRDDLLQT